MLCICVFLEVGSAAWSRYTVAIATFMHMHSNGRGIECHEIISYWFNEYFGGISAGDQHKHFFKASCPRILWTTLVDELCLLDVEASFCYLGDMLSASAGCSLAIITRCCTAWGKSKKLLPILTSKHISLTVRGKVFDTCVQSALLHGSET